MVKKIVAAVVIALVVILIWPFIFPKNDKDLIKQQFAELAQAASKEASESTTTVLFNAHTLGSLFDEHCEVSGIDDLLMGDFSREEIVSKAITLKRMFSVAKISFYDITVKFPSKDKADVVVTARFKGTINAGEPVEQIRELSVILLKKDGKWLFSNFTLSKVLEK